MARNVEIKARVDSVDAVAPRAARLAAAAPVEIVQDDTFFHCARGRLKLRKFADDDGELIFYRREDLPGPKPSFYLRSPTTAPDAMRESLALAWGQSGRVVKRRTLYLAGRTRIHLDRVDGLGDFVELEVVLGDDEPVEAGVREAHALMERLGIEPGQLVEGAYVDLLRAGAAPEGTALQDFELRPARVEDAAGVAACVCEAYVHYIERIGRQPGPMLPDYARVIADAQVQVAVAAGRIVGSIVTEITGEGFYVDNVAVRPDVKGMGVGRALLLHAEARARALGYASLYLATHEKMSENRALYARSRYVECDRRVVGGFPRVFLRKALA